MLTPPPPPPPPNTTSPFTPTALKSSCGEFNCRRFTPLHNAHIRGCSLLTYGSSDCCIKHGDLGRRGVRQLLKHFVCAPPTLPTHARAHACKRAHTHPGAVITRGYVSCPSLSCATLNFSQWKVIVSRRTKASWGCFYVEDSFYQVTIYDVNHLVTWGLKQNRPAGSQRLNLAKYEPGQH